MFTEQSNTSSLDSLLIAWVVCQGQDLLRFIQFTHVFLRLFRQRINLAENTHLNGQETIRIGKNTVGVNVTLEPLGTKNICYGLRP